MDAKKEPRKLSTSNTKQEMLDAYNTIVKQLKEMQDFELKPEKKIEEKRTAEVLIAAQAVSSNGVASRIAGLKTEIGKMLGLISDKLEDEAEKLGKVEQAVKIRENELRELYGIEKEAQTLAALIESQNKKREGFEVRMAEDREELTIEIETMRAAWIQEKKAKEQESKELEITEKKKRDREKEEFDYAFKREQKLAKDAFEDEKAQLEKDMQNRKKEMERLLQDRENALALKEQEMIELQKKVNAFPKELETAVKKSVEEATQRLTGEAKARENLYLKEFEGERKVLTTRIDGLEKMVKEQHDQITRLNQQIEKSYQKVEDIAIKAVQSASGFQSVAGLQQMISEQSRKQNQEKL